MPNRRRPEGLKIPLAQLHGLATVPAVSAARVGGIGLAWEDVPTVLDEVARAEWMRLAKVYERHPTRFREGDRAILAAFCLAWSVYVAACGELAADGLLVEGRSAPDRGRRVKAPAMVVWTQAGTQLRHLASALGLSPDARGRSGIREDEPGPYDEDANPFRAPGRVSS